MGEFTHSKTLFTNKDGTQIKFYMAPSSERRKLKPYIEYGGGLLSNRDTRTDAIKLAVPGSTVHSDDYIRSRYILDCVEQGKILDLQKYKLSDGEVCPDGSESDFDIDEDIIPNKLLIRSDRGRFGRKKYFVSEDLAIIRFLLDEGKYSDVGGNTVWKEMETLEITKHTWQSMKYRYYKVILKNIHTYRISDLDVARLKGTVGSNKEDKSSPEKSPRKAGTDEKAVESKDKSINKRKGSSDSDVTGPLDDLDEQLMEMASNPNTSRQNLDDPQSPTETADDAKVIRSSKPKINPQKLDLPTGATPSKSLRKSPRIANHGSNNSESVVSNAHQNMEISPSKPEERQDLSMSVSYGHHDETDDDVVSGKKSYRETSQAYKESLMNFLMEEEQKDNIHTEETNPLTKNVEVVKKIIAWLGLTHAEFVHTLYQTSGSVDDAVQFILHGTTKSVMWDRNADEMLKNNEISSSLKKYARKEIDDRKKFLGIL